jgi:hypothetical protein
MGVKALRAALAAKRSAKLLEKYTKAVARVEKVSSFADVVVVALPCPRQALLLIMVLLACYPLLSVLIDAALLVIVDPAGPRTAPSSSSASI